MKPPHLLRLYANKLPIGQQLQSKYKCMQAITDDLRGQGRACGERLGCTRLALAAAAVKVEAVL